MIPGQGFMCAVMEALIDDIASVEDKNTCDSGIFRRQCYRRDRRWLTGDVSRLFRCQKGSRGTLWRHYRVKTLLGIHLDTDSGVLFACIRGQELCVDVSEKWGFIYQGIFITFARLEPTGSRRNGVIASGWGVRPACGTAEAWLKTY